MKKILFVCLLLAMSFTQAQNKDAYKKDTIELIKLTGAGSAFDAGIEQLGAMISGKNKAAYTKDAKAELDKLYDELSDLYMEEFTQEEIKELLAFYNSPIGKKFTSKQLDLTKKGVELGKGFAEKVQRLAQKYQW
ncbi:DUF2059 domain-containing protein [Tamlana sp. 2_MG-2023]|uniref:DUF2059 domain-containing protein n=1 Tax=unclassified Tamlana TaxID=2614803 RepID=UPI0026E477C7|nr:MULTISPECIES: DUF2059 domain-containing protein [unclassified Tamlana]MDO6759769.1 DUF2059 domain-containing protein [Tamlana sp. 2_MG-2023]MDO6791392.1 DUF2059 domain-containing protein [Tamlana sp. 1_MG-2023]